MSEKKRIAVAHPVLDGNEKKYVLDCMDTGWISSAGKYIALFEEAFANYCGVAHGVACSNGTTALHLALSALGVGAGDEVLVPTLTFIATANAVRYCGAEPVFVDSEPRTMNIDPEAILGKLTPRTKGIIVVHLYGHPVDMDPIVELARKRGLFVVEDAAEAHGARYKGRKAGSLADASTFSFYGNKIITTGEGGMVTTNNAELLEKMRILRGQGMDPQKRYWFPVVGFNYRMTNIQAAIGLAQLEQIERHLRMRQEVAGWYRGALTPFLDVVTLPTIEDWAHHAFWAYSILLKSSSLMGRDDLIEALSADDIETRPLFYPVHTMPPYGKEGESHPVAEALSQRGITLPMHGLLNRDDVSFICSRLVAYCAGVTSATR